MLGSIGITALLPPAPTFATFALAGLMLNLIPGADMAFVATAAARAGVRRGAVAALGIGTGTLVHIAAAVLGLSALLSASATAFEVVRWAGVAYLLWIAVGLARGGANGQTAAATYATGWRLFRDGALVNILNPKIALFFLAFLPQFVPVQAPHPSATIALLGLWFDLVGTLVNIGVAALVAGATMRFQARPAIARAAQLGAAGLIGGLAMKLAVDRR